MDTNEPLTDKQFARLEPFLHHKRARQRLILFLLAVGYTPRKIVDMDKAMLAKTKFRDEMETFVEQVLESIEYEHDKAFAYPKGRAFMTEDIYRIIRQTTVRELNKTLPVADFQLYIKHGWGAALPQ